MSCRSAALAFAMLTSTALTVEARPYPNVKMDYTVLRAKLDKAERADMPKDALDYLRQMEEITVREGIYDYMLHDMLRRMKVAAQISPDSVKAERRRIIAQYHRWKDTDPIMATLCRTVMPEELGVPKLDSLLASKDSTVYMRENGQKDYVGLIQRRGDSKYFDNNLLGVIATETRQYRALYDHYRSAGDRKAACLAGALHLTHRGSREFGDTLINDYGDLEECGAVAVRMYDKLDYSDMKEYVDFIDNALSRWPEWKEMPRLVNHRKELTQPQIHPTAVRRVVTSDDDVVLRFDNVRNVKGVKVVAKRRANDSKTGYDLVRNYEKAIALSNDYEFAEDSLHLGRLPLGRWDVVVSDTEGKIKDGVFDFEVTDLKIISQSLPQGKKRYVVVDALTGYGVAGATLHIRKNYSANKARQFVTDRNGEVILSEKDYGADVRATTPNDTAMKFHNLHQSAYSIWQKSNVTQTRIYTDRAIYRPGQTVKVATVSFKVDEDAEMGVVCGDTVKVRIYDAQGKMVEETGLVADEYGTASMEYTIPNGMRNGRWRISTDSETQFFQVEEYKRPTFDVTLVKPETAYKVGDTLQIKGVAQQYNGVPVVGAKVAYRVRRNRQWWWRSSGFANSELLTDTVLTAQDGSFTLRMPMSLPERKTAEWMPYYYKETLVATVTNTAGETHSAEMTMPLSNRDSYMMADIASQHLADSAITVLYNRYNMAGTKIDGDVMLTLDGESLTGVKANEPYVLPRTIASGEHCLVAICGQDTLKNTFVAFRKGDTRPMKATRSWFYQSATAWKSSNDSVWIQYGTSDDDVQVYYTVLANDSVIEQGTKHISNENVTRTLEYKPEYGDGLSVALAWVRNGEMHSDVLNILRPLSDKTLNMEWETFRDRVKPGEKEQWTVRITHPDGLPANAVMQAVLYDKSLDQLRKHSWEYFDPRNLFVRSAYWNTPNYWSVGLRLSQQVKYLSVPSLKLSFISHYGASYYGVKSYGSERLLARSSNVLMVKSAVGAFDVVGGADTEGKDFRNYTRLRGGAPVLKEVSVSQQSGDTKTATETAPQALQGRIGGLSLSNDAETISLRSDFAETAFFLPAVKTDSKGRVTMKFTLPESVTTWRFMALAHDKGMSVGALTAEAVAQKELMVQPNMPRFLRKGDRASIAATVANMSDKDRDVKVMMTILDAETEKELLSLTEKVDIKKGETAVVTFPFDTKEMDEGAIICRFTARSAKFSDGEQRLLPLLSDKEMVTTTAAFSLEQPVDTVLAFGGLIPEGVEKAHLKVDYVDNPAWLMMETLPAMANPDSRNAATLATALYANRVGAKLKWTEDNSADVLSSLQQLQNSDGSFSWWQGMRGSTYMTSIVVETLTRLNSLCGKQEDTRQMLDKAFAFLQKNIDGLVARMKDKKSYYEPGVSPYTLMWLYFLALEGRDGGESEDYLMKYVVEDTKYQNMMAKAVAAIVLNRNGQKREARTFAESIKQHTVYRKDVGRYFDADRAGYSWCDYRIPYQTVAIEALCEVTPDDRRTIGEMKRWLLNSKRTQQWDNAYTTVNAVHAFFSDGVSVLTHEKGQRTLADREVRPVEAKVKVNKITSHESWVAAFVTFQQRTAEVQSAATGLSVRREVLKDGKPVSETGVKVGDRVTVRLTITADRDYDFVTVKDNKAACMEPVETLSGYRQGYYKEVKDEMTALHFDQMAKGTHTVECEYYIDRVGDYLAGTVTAECAYANEYRGTAASYEINVGK